MVNILLDMFDIEAPYLKEALSRHLRPGQKVAVLPFTYDDRDMPDAAAYDRLYHPVTGKYYSTMTDGLMAYGIAPKDITFLNPFVHSSEDMRSYIQKADILYFPGGLPDRLYAHICRLGLKEAVLAHRGIAMGFSAGAVVQLGEYHLSPDKDYPHFGYYPGFGLIDGFYLEVHYEGTPVQEAAIQRVLTQRRLPVYATAFNAGAVLIEDGQIHLLGDVKVYLPKPQEM